MPNHKQKRACLGVFQAEHIVNKRVRLVDGEHLVEYLIKWQDYPSANNTWEPAENVLDLGLVLEYNQRTNAAAATPSTSRVTQIGSSSKDARREESCTRKRAFVDQGPSTSNQISSLIGAPPGLIGKSSKKVTFDIIHDENGFKTTAVTLNGTRAFFTEYL